MHAIKNRIIAFLIILWLKSIRVKRNYKLEQNYILSLWHQDLLTAMLAFKDKDVCVMISASSDGEIASLVANSFGYKVFRGSNSSHSTALRHLLRELKSDSEHFKFVGMALDGPRGPYKKIQPGVFWLHQNSKDKIALIKISYSKAWQLKSWDQAKVPLPFSKVSVDLDVLDRCSTYEKLLAKINKSQ